MATSIDISPTVGHAILATQLGVGSSPGYDAIDLRRSFANLQEGTFDGTSWKVTESTPNAMTVDVAANNGRAAVQGDAITNQGLYIVAPHSAVATLTIAANASGNPRVDQIVLQTYDDTHDGSGNNKATLTVLQGTATAGATLDNRSGAASLPNSTMRLADVLVASGASTITNSVIRDRRPWARGARWRGVSTSGAQSITVAGGEMKTDTLKARIECSGGLVLVQLTAWIAPVTTSDPEVVVAPWIDGTFIEGSTSTEPAGADFPVRAIPSGGEDGVAKFSVLTAPTAGSHLFSVWAALSTGTVNFKATANSPAIFSVVELLGSTSANNGTS
jgi:hypothetical protein